MSGLPFPPVSLDNVNEILRPWVGAFGDARVFSTFFLPGTQVSPFFFWVGAAEEIFVFPSRHHYGGLFSSRVPDGVQTTPWAFFFL